MASRRRFAYFFCAAFGSTAIVRAAYQTPKK